METGMEFQDLCHFLSESIKQKPSQLTILWKKKNKKENRKIN